MRMARMLPWLIVAVLLPIPCAAQLRGQIGDDGRYSIGDGRLSFSGTLGGGTRGRKTSSGSDRIGKFHVQSVRFRRSGAPMTAAIRLYDDQPIAVFSLTYEADTVHLRLISRISAACRADAISSAIRIASSRPRRSTANRAARPGLSSTIGSCGARLGRFAFLPSTDRQRATTNGNLLRLDDHLSKYSSGVHAANDGW